MLAGADAPEDSVLKARDELLRDGADPAEVLFIANRLLFSCSMYLRIDLHTDRVDSSMYAHCPSCY